MNRRTVLTGLALTAVTALAACGCGESAEEKAQAQVCDARAGIKSEIESLRGLTGATVTVDAVRESVDSIRADLKDISAARGDLSEERRDDLKAANTAFTGSIREIGANVLRSQSVEDARTQLSGAADSLAASYRSTLGTFDCG